MLIFRCFMIISSLILLYNVECWTNYRINFRSVHVDYCNPDYYEVHRIEIQKKNRTFSTFFVNLSLLQNMDDANIDGQFYKYMSNRYKENFPLIKTHFCTIVNGVNSIAQPGFVGTFLSKLIGPLRDIIFKPGQKFPSSCPLKADNYYIRFHVDEDKLPGFFLPEGRWMLNGQVYGKEAVHMNISIHYDVIYYVNEKQKRRG